MVALPPPSKQKVSTNVRALNSLRIFMKQIISYFSIVDKSVTLVPNPNKVTSNKLSQLKKALAKKKIVNDAVRGEKCQNAKLLYKAFQKLGQWFINVFMNSPFLTVFTFHIEFNFNSKTIFELKLTPGPERCD